MTNNHNQLLTIDFRCLEHALPELIWRARWNELALAHGLPFRKGYMQNLDSLGLGPERSYLRGRVVYRKDALITWLNSFVAKSTQADDGVKIPSWLDE